MDGDIRVAAEALDPAQDGVVWAGRTADGVDHRESDGEEQRREQARQHDQGRRDCRDCDLDAVGRCERAPGVEVDEPEGCDDDHSAEHRLRQVCDRLGQEQQHERDGTGGDQSRDLTARPHLVVDGGP